MATRASNIYRAYAVHSGAMAGGLGARWLARQSRAAASDRPPSAGQEVVSGGDGDGPTAMGRRRLHQPPSALTGLPTGSTGRRPPRGLHRACLRVFTAYSAHVQRGRVAKSDPLLYHQPHDGQRQGRRRWEPTQEGQRTRPASRTRRPQGGGNVCVVGSDVVESKGVNERCLCSLSYGSNTAISAPLLFGWCKTIGYSS